MCERCLELLKWEEVSLISEIFNSKIIPVYCKYCDLIGYSLNISAVVSSKTIACLTYLLNKLLQLGPVVQSTFSINPGLNFNLLFWFMHFCSTVGFKTLNNKSSIDREDICGKTCSTS